MTESVRAGTQSRADLVALVVAGVSWGFSGTLGTLLNRSSGLPLLSVAGYRIAVGGLLIMLVIGVTRHVRLPRHRSGWTRVLVIGGCSAIYQLGFFAAIGHIGVALATLVAIGSAPIMVLIVDAALGRQLVTARLILTIAIALVGLVLLIGAPPTDITTAGLVKGALLALLAGAGFAGISLVGSRPEPDFHHSTGTALAFLLGGAVVLGFASTRGAVFFPPGPTSILLAIALGLIPTAVAYLAYLRGLRSHSSTTGVLVSLLEPITAATLAAVVLGERLTVPALAGAALLLGAVALTTTSR